MSTSVEPTVNTPAPNETRAVRLSRIVRWAARITSIPIFALLLVSLVPALSSFALSAKDDRIISIAMCGVAVGFILGWRWAGIGGALAGLSVGAMLSQEDSILADPFSVAFGLQAILFLISWSLDSSSSKPAASQMIRLKRAILFLLAASAVAGAVVIIRGPGPTPIPKEKASYVGTWESATGLRIEITPEGCARVTQGQNAKVEPCNTPLNGVAQGDFLVDFPTDDRLQLTRGPLQSTKVYHIDRHPFPDRKEIKMVLNGSDPYQRTNGMLLVKQPVEAKTSPSASRN